MLRTTKDKADPSPFRLLCTLVLAALVLAAVGFTQVLDDSLRTVRNKFHVHQASGEIVFVPIDDRALRDVGRYPWPRRFQAELVQQFSNAGAKRILFDLTFATRTNPVDDGALSTAISSSGRVVLPVRGASGPDNMLQESPEPLPMFMHNAALGSIAITYNFQNAVLELPYSVPFRGHRLPSYAAIMAGSPLRAGSFPIDYSIDPRTIPHLDPAKVASGKFDRRLVAGKMVIIGISSEMLGDQFYMPGYGKMGGSNVQILGAETLKSGSPVDLGWWPGLLLACALAGLAAVQRRRLVRNSILGGTMVGLLIVPAFLEMRLIFADVVPGLFVVTAFAAVLGSRALRKRGLVNPVSNLPNLVALRSNRDGRNQALIAARILNYEEITAALPASGEQQLMEQIVSRLRVGAEDRVLYQGDDGIFAWFEDPKAPFGNHLEALYSMFRNPARVVGLPVDLAIAFGVEVGSSRSVGNRLASALIAADEAARDGLKWKYHDPDTLHDASWKLSMLSQLDAAIDRGEVWVAYQPKLDLATRRIIGAEALARWTHPEKGPIAASEFVAAAEQSDRIAKLTDFVLDKAIAAAASINKQGHEFEIAVNLSARLLTDRGLLLRVSALLARHRLAPRLLTLELTETATLAGSGEAFDMITCLRELGLNISIDDYGTGLSTLDYLKKIPASEIKIDQSFVKGMVDNRSDRLMVQSTISLAHSLGRTVVAEGVEQFSTLELLIEMKCDIAQGFAIGRPMSLESLAKRLTSERKRGVA